MAPTWHRRRRTTPVPDRRDDRDRPTSDGEVLARSGGSHPNAWAPTGGGAGRGPAGGGGARSGGVRSGEAGDGWPSPARRIAGGAPSGDTRAVPVQPAPSPAGGPGRPPRVRPRRRHRVLKASVGGLAVVVLIVAGLYAYVRYQWSQVKTVACTRCAVVDDTQPFNVLVVGSDTRAGNTGGAAQAFGSQAQVGGQRSDTIKVLHVDPAAGMASMLSIPRDTFVPLSGRAPNSQLARDNKINAAFDSGTNGLVQTIENTFGIPIQHVVIVNFNDVVNLVNAVGGIRMNFPFPARDNDAGNNNSGLNIPNPGCQTLNGTQALSLSRSRYYQYDENGVWHSDPTSDIGRIKRQDLIIEAVIAKAKSDYNPLSLNALLSTVVNDVTVDGNMSFSTMVSLAERYHAFSPSALGSHTYTLPTMPAVSSYAGDILVVQEPQAQQVISTFLGGSPRAPATPPVDQYGNPLDVSGGSGSSSPSSGGGPASSGSSAAASTGSASGGSSAPTGSAGTPAPTDIPFYDPTPC